MFHPNKSFAIYWSKKLFRCLQTHVLFSLMNNTSPCIILLIWLILTSNTNLQALELRMLGQANHAPSSDRVVWLQHRACLESYFNCHHLPDARVFSGRACCSLHAFFPSTVYISLSDGLVQSRTPMFWGPWSAAQLARPLGRPCVH